MSSKANNFLKKALGEDIFESLAKAELWKPGTRTVVDSEEIATALQIVPRTVMVLLIRDLAHMSIGEHKDIHLPFGKDSKLIVDKHERDVYSGHVEEDNKIVVDFKYRSLPGIGLVIMSAFELYEVEKLSQPAPAVEPSSDIEHKVQQLIEERLQLHDLINKVVDRKLMQKEAVQHLMLAKLTNAIHAEPAPEVHHVEIAKKEPSLEEKKKGSPLKGFLDGRKKKNEFSIELSKGETVNCPDCQKNIFDGKLFSGCVCLGDDMERKVFIKKTEDGYNVRFSKGWDPENIEMLLEVLRRKNG